MRPPGQAALEAVEGEERVAVVHCAAVYLGGPQGLTPALPVLCSAVSQHLPTQPTPQCCWVW